MKKVKYISSNNLDVLAEKVNEFTEKLHKENVISVCVKNNIVVDSSPKLMRQNYIQKITWDDRDQILPK